MRLVLRGGMHKGLAERKHGRASSSKPEILANILQTQMFYLVHLFGPVFHILPRMAGSVVNTLASLALRQISFLSYNTSTQCPLYDGRLLN